MSFDTLADLEAALADDDRARVIELFPDVTDAFRRRRQREGGFDEVAARIRAEAGTDGGTAEAAASYTAAASGADQARMALTSSLVAYFEGESGPEQQLDAVRSVLDAEREVADATEALEDAVAGTDVSVPVVLAVAATDRVTFPKGVERTVEGTVSNLGGTPAESVGVAVETDLDLAVEPTALGTLAPGDSATVTLSGTPTTVGVFETTVTATGDSDEAATTVATAVAGTGEFLQSALQDVRDLAEAVEEIAGEGGGRGSGNGGGGANGLLNKLETIEKRLERLVSRIDAGRHTPGLDNEIRSVIEELDAFLHQLDALTGTQVPAGDAAALRHDAGDVKRRLEDAIRAEV